MSDWRYRLAEQRGTLLAAALFLVMFVIYVSNHPAGFTSNVVQTAANKGVLLALVAMAQTMVVLTAGIDLSVGMIFIFTNCLASYIVTGSTPTAVLGLVGVLIAGLACGVINGLIVIYGRLQPIVTTIATGSIFYGIALWLRPQPGSSDNFNSDIADWMTGKLPGGIPTSLVTLLVVVLVIWVPFRRSEIGRAVYATGSSRSPPHMSGVAIRRAKMTAYSSRLLSPPWAGSMSPSSPIPARPPSPMAAPIPSIPSPPWCWAASRFRGRGQRHRRHFGAGLPHLSGDSSSRLRSRAALAAAVQGAVLLLRRSASAQPARLFQVRNRLDLFA
jgi:ribose transport system permease protein